MEKIKLMNSLIDDIKALTNTLEKIVQLENGKEDNRQEVTNNEKKILTLEELRAFLAKKSKEGFTDDIKNLINYYGCHKLSEIDSKYYAEILEKAKNLNK